MTGRAQGSLRERQPDWLEALRSRPPRCRTFGEKPPLAAHGAPRCGLGSGPWGSGPLGPTPRGAAARAGRAERSRPGGRRASPAAEGSDSGGGGRAGHGREGGKEP